MRVCMCLHVCVCVCCVTCQITVAVAETMRQCDPAGSLWVKPISVSHLISANSQAKTNGGKISPGTLTPHTTVVYNSRHAHLTPQHSDGGSGVKHTPGGAMHAPV